MALMIFIPLLIIFLFPSLDAHAGAAVARQRQMKAMRGQAQDQMIQQAIQQRQQEEIQAYQQAMAAQQAAQEAAQIQAVQQMIMQQMVQAQIEAQIAVAVRQAQIQAAEQAAVKQAVEAEIARQLVQQAAVGQAIQVRQVQQEMIARAVAVQVQNRRVRQISDERDITIAKAVMQARKEQLNQAYAGAAVQQAAGQVAAYQQAQAMRGAAVAQQAGALGRPYEQVSSNEVKDVVDITEVWQRLDKDSRAWALLIDNQAKALTVEEFIDRFRKEGAKIQKSPAQYALAIDQMASQNPQMLTQPFKDLVRLTAVMEYDFDNGMDRDALAKKVLGDKFYQDNKKRLGI